MTTTATDSPAGTGLHALPGLLHAAEGWDPLRAALAAGQSGTIDGAWGSSADYDAAPDLGKIEATLLAINAADDERNPPETGVTEAAMKRVKNGRLYLIPASTETRGHLTTGSAKLYKQQLQDLLQTAPQRTM